MVRIFAAALAVLLVSACDEEVEPVCRAAEAVACTGSDGCAGVQICNPRGTGFGPCECGPRPDGGRDAGVDAGTPGDDAGFDAGAPLDDAGFDAGGPADAGFDAGEPPDAGVDAAAPDAAVADAGLDAGPLACAPACAATERCCATSCVNRGVPQGTDGRADPSFLHCNGCGLACDVDRASSCSVPGGGPGTERCMCGDVDQCVPGEACVDDGGGSFACTDLDSDPLHCGMAGNACGEGESCVGGMCECGTTGAACGVGQACCGGGCIDVTSDAANCGGCGIVCGPHAPDCDASACTCSAAGVACTAPTAGDPGETCCDSRGCVANTDTSCPCSTVCTGVDECVSAPVSGGSDFEVCCGDPSTTPTAGCP